jgi:hypothetical protein
MLLSVHAIWGSASAPTAQQLDKEITPERRALHRLTIRSQPRAELVNEGAGVEVPSPPPGPRLRACATSTPSTLSCAWWRLGSEAGRCHR